MQHLSSGGGERGKGCGTDSNLELKNQSQPGVHGARTPAPKRGVGVKRALWWLRKLHVSQILMTLSTSARSEFHHCIRWELSYELVKLRNLEISELK